MIDGVGKSGPGRIDFRRGEIGKSQSATPSGDALGQTQVSSPASLIADLAAGPPVNAEKIAALRAAIAEGRYPVDPQKIAERMIALDIPVRSQQ